MTAPDPGGIGPGDIDAAVADILEAAGLGAGHAPLVARHGGLDHTVYATRTPKHRLLVKTVAVGPGRLPAAAWAAATLAAAGIPVPRVLGYTSRVCVETRCPGRALDTMDDLPVIGAVAAGAGALLRRVHAITVSGFGRLDAAGRGTHPDLRAWLLDRRPPPASATSWRALLDEVHHTLAEHAGRLAAAGARLLHGDWAARHVIAADGRVTGLVDLASVRGGDPLTDLAAWSLQESAALTRALFAGYFRTPPDEAARTALTLYRLRIAASLLAVHSVGNDTVRTMLRARQLRADLEDLARGTPRTAPRICPEPPFNCEVTSCC
ncbi:MAG TPA: phosphotransferase [Actinoplanes sp.]|nr:phosphotransferase [Actinoplanes sp.]